MVQPATRLTVDDYLALEADSEERHEFLDGEVFAMGGASPSHVLVVTNLAAELRDALKKTPCRVFSTDLRVRVSATGLSTYPDLVVACGEMEWDESGQTLLNPQLLVEVLSESTEDYDRGEKFAHYRTLDSFVEYLLISQSEARAELYSRQGPKEWLMTEIEGLSEEIEFKSVRDAAGRPVRLQLSEVYDKVAW